MSAPQPGAPAPTFRGYAAPVFWFLAGLVLFAIAAVGALFAVSTIPPNTPRWVSIMLALVFLGLTAVAAIFALRRGRVALGSGLLLGYAVATAFSSGQCTFWSTNAGYEIITAFFVYLLAMFGVLVSGLVAFGVDLIRRSRLPRDPA